MNIDGRSLQCQCLVKAVIFYGGKKFIELMLCERERECVHTHTQCVLFWSVCSCMCTYRSVFSLVNIYQRKLEGTCFLQHTSVHTHTHTHSMCLLSCAAIISLIVFLLLGGQAPKVSRHPVGILFSFSFFYFGHLMVPFLLRNEAVKC